MEQETLKMRRMHSREPWLFDLTNFAEDEMTLVSDPLYSRDGEELEKVNISKKLKVGSRCPLCNENHDIEACVFFRHWKNEVSYFISENYVMDVLKKLPISIIQNLVQTEEHARYAMANIQQHFMDMLERKSKIIIKRMIVQIHQMEVIRNVHSQH